MEEREFNVLADAMLARIEAALESCDSDFDYETKAGGVIELEFANGSKLIINRHTAAREIWLAAKSGGYHFRPPETGSPPGQWRATRDGEDLLAALARCMSEQAGVAVTLG